MSPERVAPAEAGRRVRRVARPTLDSDPTRAVGATSAPLVCAAAPTAPTTKLRGRKAPTVAVMRARDALALAASWLPRRFPRLRRVLATPKRRARTSSRRDEHRRAATVVHLRTARPHRGRRALVKDVPPVGRTRSPNKLGAARKEALLAAVFADPSNGSSTASRRRSGRPRRELRPCAFSSARAAASPAVEFRSTFPRRPCLAAAAARRRRSAGGAHAPRVAAAAAASARALTALPGGGGGSARAGGAAPALEAAAGRARRCSARRRRRVRRPARSSARAKEERRSRARGVASKRRQGQTPRAARMLGGAEGAGGRESHATSTRLGWARAGGDGRTHELQAADASSADFLGGDARSPRDFALGRSRTS